MKKLIGLVPLLVLLMPAHVFACAVCMGAPGSNVTAATNGLIFAMLGFVGAMLTGIGAFCLRLMWFAKTPKPAHEELAGIAFEQGMEEGAQHA